MAHICFKHFQESKKLHFSLYIGRLSVIEFYINLLLIIIMFFCCIFLFSSILNLLIHMQICINVQFFLIVHRRKRLLTQTTYTKYLVFFVFFWFFWHFIDSFYSLLTKYAKKIFIYKKKKFIMTVYILIILL